MNIEDSHAENVVSKNSVFQAEQGLCKHFMPRMGNEQERSFQSKGISNREPLQQTSETQPVDTSFSDSLSAQIEYYLEMRRLLGVLEEKEAEYVRLKTVDLEEWTIKLEQIKEQVNYWQMILNKLEQEEESVKRKEKN